ncbi:type IVB secretion system protein IcmH/DotU [Pseudomonas nicosulfuronedens]
MSLTLSRNPFGDSSAPGAAATSNARQGQHAAQRAESELGDAGNPLLAAANPLLNLAPQIRLLTQHPDPDALHRQLVEEIRRFERQAQSLNIRTEEIIAARYCLCTVLDESAALTPWGSGTWAARSLLVTFHNEAWGGEKFFQLLSRLAADPQQHRNLLELQYYCLCLGFEGQYRIMEHGHSALETLKQRLLAILQGKRAAADSELSPHWRSAVAYAGGLRSSIPFWVYTSLLVLLLALLYSGFLLALQGPGERLALAIGSVQLAKLEISTPTTRTLADFLAPEIAEHLLSVREEDDRSVIVIRGNGVFASGASQVKPSYLSVIKRIGQALQSRKGRVEVLGYTDNQPIRFQFTSNVELSDARASAVRDLLVEDLGKERLSSRGLGEDHPLTSNETAEGRALNRRVEIVLFKPDMPQEKSQ